MKKFATDTWNGNPNCHQRNHWRWWLWWCENHKFKYFHLFKWQIFTKDDQILLSPLLVDWHYLIKSQSCELRVCQSICWSSFEYSHFDVTYNYALGWKISLHKYLIRFRALSWWVLEHFLAETSAWHFTMLLTGSLLHNFLQIRKLTVHQVVKFLRQTGSKIHKTEIQDTRQQHYNQRQHMLVKLNQHSSWYCH